MGLLNFGKKNTDKEPAKKPNAEIFLDIITTMFGEPYVIRRADTADGGGPVHVFFWRDLPEEGMLTSVTYGLSEGSHPDWKNGKCEIITTLETTDENWGIASGIFAARNRGESSFAYGSLFTTDDPLSKESDMRGFLVFAPSFLSKDESVLYLPDYKIFLKGMYPIYREEVAVYNEIGLDEFWHSKNFGMYDVHRPKVEAE